MISSDEYDKFTRKVWFKSNLVIIILIFITITSNPSDTDFFIKILKQFFATTVFVFLFSVPVLGIMMPIVNLFSRSKTSVPSQKLSIFISYLALILPFVYCIDFFAGILARTYRSDFEFILTLFAILAIVPGIFIYLTPYPNAFQKSDLNDKIVDAPSND